MTETKPEWLEEAANALRAGASAILDEEDMEDIAIKILVPVAPMIAADALKEAVRACDRVSKWYYSDANRGMSALRPTDHCAAAIRALIEKAKADG